MDNHSRRRLEAEKEEARKQRQENAKQQIQQPQQSLPVFGPPKKVVNDPTNIRVQNILGKLVVPLLNESTIGVPLAPMTPISAVPNVKSSSKLPSGNSVDIISTGHSQSVKAVIRQPARDDVISKTDGVSLKARSSDFTHKSRSSHPSQSGSAVDPNKRMISNGDLKRHYPGSPITNEDSKPKLQVKITPEVDKILQEMILPPELTAIVDTPVKFIQPPFPGVEEDESADSSDSDGDPLFRFNNNCQPVELPTTNQPNRPSSVNSDCSGNQCSVIVTPRGYESGLDPSSPAPDTKIDCNHNSSVTPATNGENFSFAKPGLRVVDDRPSVLVQLRLPKRFRCSNETENQSSQDSSVETVSDVRTDSQAVPAPITAAEKGRKVAQEALANIVGISSTLPLTLKFPKKQKMDENAADNLSPSNRDSYGDGRQSERHRRGGERSRYETSEVRRYGSPSLRRDSSRSYKRHSQGQSRYSDFDQPLMDNTDSLSYFSGNKGMETEPFGVPVIDDPYADFVPDDPDELPGDDNRQQTIEPEIAPAEKQKGKTIGAVWGEIASGSSNASKHLKRGERYREETDYLDADYRRRGGDYRDKRRRYDKRASNAKRPGTRDSDIDDDRRKLSPWVEHSTPLSDTDQVHETVSRQCYDKLVGTTPKWYESTESQTEVADMMFLQSNISQTAATSVRDESSQYSASHAQAIAKDYTNNLKPCEVYYAEARKLKHAGSGETDLFKRHLLYLESALLFTEHSYCLERKKQFDRDATYAMYNQTYKMCSSSGSRALNLPPKSQIPSKWRIIDILSLRMQSYIRQQMWRLKMSECQRKKDIINNFTRPAAAGVAGTVNGVEGGSVKSDSGSSADSPMNSVHSSVPHEVMTAVQDYMEVVDNLVASCQLWEKANNLISTCCPDFFASLTFEHSELTRECHLSALATTVRASLSRLRAMTLDA